MRIYYTLKPDGLFGAASDAEALGKSQALAIYRKPEPTDQGPEAGLWPTYIRKPPTNLLVSVKQEGTKGV